MVPTLEMAVKPRFPDTTSLLQYFYQDIRYIYKIVSDNIILYTADRDILTPLRPPLRGIIDV